MPTQTDTPKYAPPVPIALNDRTWPGRTIAKAPRFVSVDLRDANQALPRPMSPERKLEYFRMLCDIGFREIELAYPSGSRGDFDFTRRLVDEAHIPDGVTPMALTMCREENIRRTVEALRGAPAAIVHLYIATSDLHIEHVFDRTRRRVREMVSESVRLVRALADENPQTDWRLEFSPEEFTDTDPVFALDLCADVVRQWGDASPERPVILNLPATVERRPPNQYADLIEWFARRIERRDAVILSVHAHNDQGMAVAATELCLLAGAERVEGALFGQGERAGNTDLVTLAMNLHSRGIETGLDLTNLPDIVAACERLTGMAVPPRQPYAGEYVFTAFSGTHQDAIRKGIRRLAEAPQRFGMEWKAPYLHIDPADVGRRYERLIRINAQSGKGGMAWVLEQDYGLELPRDLLPELGRAVQAEADRTGAEMSSERIYEIFIRTFVDVKGSVELTGYWPRPDETDPGTVQGDVTLKVNGHERRTSAAGNGPVSAFVNALASIGLGGFTVEDYHEQALGRGADARAVAYVPLRFDGGEVRYGVGIDTNIEQAAVRAVVSGLNRRDETMGGMRR